MRSIPLLAALLGAAAACAGGSAPAPRPAPAPAQPPANPPAKPNIDPTNANRPDVVLRPDSGTPKEREPVAPPELAAARGLMGLASTGADAFHRAHPTADGRGILLGILDTGVDPTVPGLTTTSTGERKVVDLRDFSGEGAVPLQRVSPVGDTVVVGGQRLAGLSRVAALGGSGPIYAGVIRERALGDAPASDLNGDGSATDTLVVVLAKATDGWVLFADTDGDGSLANEKPIHDYLVANETFGWARRGRRPQVALAVNVSESDGKPVLDLYFDTSSHGTFVAGIAAGHDIYGVKGFDGVAPGVQLLGLKIANDAQGGITTTGSMVRALDYAIRFADRKRLPLVLNMSFGVGNEREGQARIDQLVDSVLAAHPGLVFAVSAGNDGPGVSTVGFPGSAARVLTAGATLPGVFLPRAFGGPPPDQLASFSSRGGELAKPDLIAPGFAYSTVPRFNTGDEIKEGTSFSSPHVAGLVALLQSALHQEGLEADARTLKQALMVTARPQGNFTFIAEGAGVPDVEAALRWLRQRHRVPDVVARPAGASGTAAFRGTGLRSPADTIQAFDLTRRETAGSLTFTLRSDSPWLVAPRTVTLTGPKASVMLRYRAAQLKAPGVYCGVVSAWTDDTLAGPAFRMVNTIVVPYPAASGDLFSSARLDPGGERRASFLADSARPFTVRMSTWSQLQAALAALHEPDGQPFRGGQQQQAGADTGAAVYRVDARDVVPGAYEAVAVGFPTAGATVSLHVEQAPFRIGTAGTASGVSATLTNVGERAVSARVGLALAGIERDSAVTSHGGDTVRIPLSAPAWARSVSLDVAMAPAQWERFTDFGVTLFDRDGAQLGRQPLNYAFGRLQVALPAAQADRPVELRLFPGLAEPGSIEAWRATLSIRFYSDSVPKLVAAATPSTRADLGPREGKSMTLTVPSAAWPVPAGYRALGILIAEAGGERWTREFALPGGTQ